MYKIYLKGLHGTVEVDRLFKSKFQASKYAELIVLRSYELCDYEIKEVLKNGKQHKNNGIENQSN